MKKLLLLLFSLASSHAYSMDPENKNIRPESPNTGAFDAEADAITDIFSQKKRSRSLSTPRQKLKLRTDLEKRFDGCTSPRLSIIEATLTEDPAQKELFIRRSVELTRQQYHTDLVRPVWHEEQREKGLKRDVKELESMIKEKEDLRSELPILQFLRRRKLSNEIRDLKNERDTTRENLELTDLQRRVLAQAAFQESNLPPRPEYSERKS